MSIGFSQVQSGIYARFGATFVAGNPPTGGWNQTAFPTVAENQNWKQPAIGPWGRFCVRFAASKDTSVDAKARRIAGVAWLQIFLSENAGSLDAQRMGDEMERIFGRKTIVSSGETIRFERAETAYIGKTADGWEQHRCTVAFISDAVTP